MPRVDDCYSIPQFVQDLSSLVKGLKLDRFHLFGHSFGGYVAYEYVKMLAEIQGAVASDSDNNEGGKESIENGVDGPVCLSLILSNAGTNHPLGESERKRLMVEFKNNTDGTHDKGKGLQEAFFRSHMCRTDKMPKPLHKALGRRGKTWSPNDYTARPSEVERAAQFIPPALIIRGEYDFVTEKCTRGWKDIFKKEEGCRELVMKGCAHYCHLEAGDEHGIAVDSFCSTADKS